MWEVTNVFFVFFFVGIVGFFPKTAFYYGTVLLIPVSIALILMMIRGSYYAFEAYGTKGHKGYAFLYGIAGLFVPASLSIALTIAEGGFVSIIDGKPVLDYGASVYESFNMVDCCPIDCSRPLYFFCLSHLVCQ